MTCCVILSASDTLILSPNMAKIQTKQSSVQLNKTTVVGKLAMATLTKTKRNWNSSLWVKYQLFHSRASWLFSCPSGESLYGGKN